MTFDEFKSNVEQWSALRGIYAHSTPQAQLLKALSELGELADAVIKEDRKGIKDGIGDVCVCLINYAHMEEIEIEVDEIISYKGISDHIHIGFAAELIGGALQGMDMPSAFDEIASVARNNGLAFLDCCAHAWNEIKDRTGHMVPGGAFVKDEP